MQTTFEIFTGKDIGSYIDIISNLRVEIFREFPYLYKAESHYEKKYIQSYMTQPLTIVSIAKVNGNVAGISTGMPLSSHSEIIMDAKDIFSAANIDISSYYYYGEVIIKPEYRTQGLIAKSFKIQDNLIMNWGFKHVCFLTVRRDNNHPLKPNNYRKPDNLWKKLGFAKNNLHTNCFWPTIQPDGSVANVSNILEFWSKSFELKK